MSFDFDHAVRAPFRMQPGLRRLAPGSPQLTPNGRDARHLHEKLAVLNAAADQALMQRPGFDAAAALAVLAAQAGVEHPRHFTIRPDGAWHAIELGWTVAADGGVSGDTAALAAVGSCLQGLLPAWRRAGLLSLAFAEDFAIVDGADASVPWLSVCLPSHWSPQDKVGRRFAEIHAPVADNALLLSAGEHLMRLVTAPQRWERFVWSLTHRAALDAHPARVAPSAWPAAGDPASLVASTFWRTERQTFLPVPGHGQAVFTIRVDCRPLVEAIVSAGQAAAVHAALASMSPAVLHYRDLAAPRDALLDWLARRAALLGRSA